MANLKKNLYGGTEYLQINKNTEMVYLIKVYNISEKRIQGFSDETGFISERIIKINKNSVEGQYHHYKVL